MENKELKQQENKEPKPIVVEYEVDGNKVKLSPNIVQQFLLNGQANVTMQEFKFFTELCKAQKLNPFLKEAYLIKFSDRNPAQIIVGKDVIVKRAVKHPMYNGKQSGVIVEKDGEVIERQGCFVSPTETLLGGWCKVFRKDWENPEYMSVSLEEVAQRKSDGQLNSNWLTKSATMVEKVAKVRALREAFIEENAGLYDEQEFKQFNDMEMVEEVRQEPKDIIEAEVNIENL